MRLRYLTCYALLMAAAMPLSAQSAAERIARGDSLYEAIRVAESLVEYEAVLAADSMHPEALWRASRNVADLAERDDDRAGFVRAERLARRAIAAAPHNADAHFDLARALGRTALSVGSRERVRYAKEIRAHALEALRLDPDHPGALHVMGMWNAEVMRLSGLARWAARNFLGGQVFSAASWGEAIRYLERAVAVDPHRIVHRLDLAKIYLDRGERDKARSQLEAVVTGRRLDLNDPRYQAEAKEILERLDGGSGE